MIYELNLPSLPAAIASLVLKRARKLYGEDWRHIEQEETRPLHHSQEELEQFNVVKRLPGPVLDVWELEEWIANAFPFPVECEFFIMCNDNRGRPAMLPPHIDRVRNLAINYVLKSGGENVYTDFFLDGQTGTHDIDYDLNLSRTSTYHVPESSWCAFNASSVHGVSNIQTTRVLLSVMSEHGMGSVEELMALHPDLFGAKLQKES